MTHDEFVDKITNQRWVVGVHDFNVILNECGHRCGKIIYLINYWSLFILFTVYCIAVVWYDGWGNMVGMPLVYWMLKVGRPNINIFDLVWLLLITMAFIGLASLLNWHLSPFWLRWEFFRLRLLDLQSLQFWKDLPKCCCRIRNCIIKCIIGK
jgi:hypothetical protein